MADPQILYPTEGLTGVSTIPTVSWSAVAGASSYKLQVDTAATFDSSAGSPLIEEVVTGGAGLLILDSHSAIAKAQQKPKQWGPLAAVQYSLKRNCEDVGINYKTVKSLLPAFEGTTYQHDLITGKKFTANNCIITPNSIDLSPGGVVYIDTATTDNWFDISHGFSMSALIDADTDPGAIFSGFGTNQTGYNQIPYLKNSYGNLKLYADAVLICATTTAPLYGMRGLNLFSAGYDGAGNWQVFINGVIVASAVKTLSYGTRPSFPVIGEIITASDTKPYTSAANYKLNLSLYGSTNFSESVLQTINEQPYFLLQERRPKVISIPSAPATSKTVTISAGTQYHARVAAEVL